MDYRYYSFACSERGSQHERDNMPCQDSALSHTCGDTGTNARVGFDFAAVAVADGHGSPECFRSDRGSLFAVECAVGCIKKFVAAIKENDIKIEENPKEEIDEIISQLTNSIIVAWNGRIEKDYKENPFNTNNPDCIEQVYGSTLLAVALTEKYWFSLQIGDGKCVVLNDDGNFYQPIPPDDRCFMNITTSMCDCDAAREFRYYFGVDKPSAIFIGTDGVDNSLANDAQLYDLYRCIAEDFVSKGADAGIEEVKKFLPALTQRGSGDDVSIAGIVRIAGR